MTTDFSQRIDKYLTPRPRFNKYLTFFQEHINLIGVLCGISIIVLALISFYTQQSLSAMMSWLEQIFSRAFIVLYLLIVSVGLWAIRHLFLCTNNKEEKLAADYWSEIASQAGNAIATLALTFTLLGISLGIGSLSNLPITQENITEIINVLTKQFSMAFMTTVIGLPSATLLRASAAILLKKCQIKS